MNLKKSLYGLTALLFVAVFSMGGGTKQPAS
jgi:hypothetical protein